MKSAFLFLFIFVSINLCQQQQSAEVEYTLKNGQLQRTDGKGIDIPENIQQQLLDSLLELSRKNPDQEYAVSLAYESSVQQTQTQQPQQTQQRSQSQQQSATMTSQQQSTNQSQQIDQRDIFDFRIEPNSSNGQTEAQIRTIYIPNSRNMTDEQIINMVQQGNYQIVDQSQMTAPNNRQTSQQNSVQTITYSYSQQSSSSGDQNETQQTQLNQNQLPNLNQTFEALKLNGNMYYQLPENDQRLQGAQLQIQDVDSALQELQNQPAQQNNTQVQVNSQNYEFQNVNEEDQNDLDALIQNFLQQQTSFTTFQQQLQEKDQQINQNQQQQDSQEDQQNQNQEQEQNTNQQQDGNVDLTLYQQDYQTVESENPEDIINSDYILNNLRVEGEEKLDFQTISPEQYEQLVIKTEQPLSYEDSVGLPQNIDYRALVELARSNNFPIPTRPQQFNQYIIQDISLFISKNLNFLGSILQTIQHLFFNKVLVLLISIIFSSFLKTNIFACYFLLCSYQSQRAQRHPNIQSFIIKYPF